MLKYPCLVLDHDDTVVQSEATVNYARSSKPSIYGAVLGIQSLHVKTRNEKSCSLENN